MNGEEFRTIVIDNGSDTCKSGFACDEAPRSVLQTALRRPKYISNFELTYVGDETCSHPSLLLTKFPVSHGIVTNWDDMERIWQYIFYKELRVDPAEHAVLLTEAPKNPKANREKMLQLQIETFNVPACCICTQPVLSLYSTDCVTGVVLESGDGASYSVPIYEGYSFPHATKRFNIAGFDITLYLQKILNQRGYLTTFNERKVVRDIKEIIAYVALDYDEELAKADTTSECDISYTLPNGDVISIGNERFRCTELLFQPHFGGFDFDGIDQCLFASIMECGADVRKDLFGNILLSGGNTMFEGLAERIENEMLNLAPTTMRIKVVSPPERKYSAWIGGRKLASLSTFPQMVTTREEYDEFGPGIVHRKCF
ncbi:actin [Histomonas meleagridis]|uniref:actin n=1 Tax=Histomonas meleagridis TaxID=135588 RepID=UPI0035599936|nr:actin [Histomonas meleagridis]KAH0803260.1 actin [Histomonas meleagridis]